MSDDGGSGNDNDDEHCLARTRSRRSGRSEKVNARTAALDKLKQLQGGKKNKYEVKEVENVYDVVDEQTYSRSVQNRQKDDWIVDDGSGCYVEDGREIFDDDLNDHDDDGDKKRKKSKSEKDKKVKKVEKETAKAGFRDLRGMLSSMPVKRKREETLAGTSSANPSSGKGVSEDDFLEDLMKELHEDKKPKKFDSPQSGSSKKFERVFPTPKAATKKVSATLLDEGLEKLVMDLDKEKPKKVETPTTILSKKFESTKLTNNKPPISKPIQKNGKVTASNGNGNHNQASHDLESNFMDSAFDDDGMDFDTSFPEPEPATTPSIPKSSLPLPPAKPKQHSSVLLNDSKHLFTPPTATGTSDTSLIYNTSNIEFPKDVSVLNFFWIDMFEEPKNPGSLYLFGKVEVSPKKYLSCCIVVKDLYRLIYLLPRESTPDGEPIDTEDVRNEFNTEIAPRYKIDFVKARKADKKYCFELKDVPTFGSYLEVRYPGTLPQLPADLTGKTFSRIFGTGSPLMENFLLEKKLKGPSWLQIANPVEVPNSNQHSWCKLEFTCPATSVRLNEDSQNMTVPPLVLASLNIQAVNDATSKKDSIIFIGVAVNTHFELQVPIKPNDLYQDYFCFVNKPLGEIWPLDVEKVFPKDKANNKITKMDSERSMLGCFLAKLQQLDADIYLGHDLNFDMLLLHLLNLKVPHWSRIGRLKRTNLIGKNNKTLDYKSALAGRLFCDVKISSMELIRARSYDLTNLAQQVLNTTVDTLTGPEMKNLFESSKGLDYLINWGMQHCVTNIQLVNELQVLPLALQITAIAGNTLFRTLLGGRSERNEYLLLHAFHSKGYIVPDKYRPFVKEVKTEKNSTDGESTSKKSSGPSYAGGMVLEPKKGFYDNFIVLMDFNSLYPSIIQEYNICFTTNGTTSETDVPENERGILPEEIRKLVESRRQVKGLMKGNISQDLMRQYDIRQKALKLTANSMYGCLGFKNSRFFAQELAALITGKGREILLRTKDSVEQMGFEVIYGDTDSIMINSNSTDVQKVYQIGNTIKSEINKMYKLLELEIDGIFRYMLLLKKKKYAAMVWNQKPNGEVEQVMELKGLDMVRRDWAPIASNIAKLVLDEIMTDQALDDKIFKICNILGEVANNLKIGNIVLKDLLITKQLAKNPEEYRDAHGLYHVQVALRMNKSGSLPKKFKNGDTVSYLFCTDGVAHHIAELNNVKEKKEDGTEVEVNLQPDPEYYLAQQIHPVVSRICEPIPGLDAGRIAESLGMDPTSFRRRRIIDENEDTSLGQQSEAEKYADCDKFSFKCPYELCKREITLNSPFTGTGVKIQLFTSKCPHCEKSFENNITFIIGNRLNLFIRKHVLQYYKNIYICEDPTCDNTIRAVPFQLIQGYPQCQRCKQGLMCKSYSDSQLYKQLTYLLYILDINKHLESLEPADRASIENQRKDKQGYEERINQLRAIAQKHIENSGYSEIKLSYLFQGLFPVTEVKREKVKEEQE